MELNVNGRTLAVPDLWSGETLLNVLREALGLCGTKYGCGVGVCGACTVLVDGEPRRACVLPASQLENARIVTVEGLAQDGKLSALQRAWDAVRVAQCGYCQAAQLMSATALLQRHPQPSDTQIEEAMAGNLCRCGTYGRIRIAIRLAAT